MIDQSHRRYVACFSNFSLVLSHQHSHSFFINWLILSMMLSVCVLHRTTIFQTWRSKYWPLDGQWSPNLRDYFFSPADAIENIFIYAQTSWSATHKGYNGELSHGFKYACTMGSTTVCIRPGLPFTTLFISSLWWKKCRIPQSHFFHSMQTSVGEDHISRSPIGKREDQHTSMVRSTFV